MLVWTLLSTLVGLGLPLVYSDCRSDLARCFKAHRYFFDKEYAANRDSAIILEDFCIAWQSLLDCYANTASCEMGRTRDIRLSITWKMGHIYFYRAGVAIKAGVCPSLHLENIYSGIKESHRRLSMVIPENYYSQDHMMECFQENMMEAALEYALMMKFKGDFCTASAEAGSIIEQHQLASCQDINGEDLQIIEDPATDFPRLVKVIESRGPSSGFGFC